MNLKDVLSAIKANDQQRLSVVLQSMPPSSKQLIFPDILLITQQQRQVEYAKLILEAYPKEKIQKPLLEHLLVKAVSLQYHEFFPLGLSHYPVNQFPDKALRKASGLKSAKTLKVLLDDFFKSKVHLNFVHLNRCLIK